MLKKIVSLVLVAAILFAFAACAQQEKPVETTQNDTPATQADTEPEKKIKIGLVVQNLANFFMKTLETSALAVGEELGVEVVVLAAANIEEQLKVMEDLIETKPDAIGIDAFDAKGIIPAVDKAMGLGIPVFAVDNKIVDTKITSFIGTDNVYGGELAAEWMVEEAGEDAVIGLVQGKPGAFATNAREEGMYKIFKDKYPNVTVAAAVTGNLQRDVAMTVANDIMTGYPNVEILFALNDEMALGAAQAIVAANKTDTVKIIGFNGVPEAIKAVYDGLMTATVVQFPELMARTFIEKAIDLVENGTVPDEQYLIPAAVIDTEQAKAIVDDNLAPTNDFEIMLYDKIKLALAQ